MACQRRREFGPRAPPHQNHMPKTSNDSSTPVNCGVIFSLWYQVLQPSLKDQFISRNRSSVRLALAMRNLLEGCREILWNLFEDIQLVIMATGKSPASSSFCLLILGNAWPLISASLHKNLPFFLQTSSFLRLFSPHPSLTQTFASFTQKWLLVILTPYSLSVPRPMWLRCTFHAIPLFRKTDWLRLGQVASQSNRLWQRGKVKQNTEFLRPKPGLLGEFWREGQHKLLKSLSLFLPVMRMELEHATPELDKSLGQEAHGVPHQ